MRFSGPIPYLKCNFLRLTSSHLSPERLTNRQDRCLKTKESYADHVDFGGLGFLEAAQGPEIGGVRGRSVYGTDTYPVSFQGHDVRGWGLGISLAVGVATSTTTLRGRRDT